MRVNAFCAIGVFFSLEANAIVDFAHSAAHFSLSFTRHSH